MQMNEKFSMCVPFNPNLEEYVTSQERELINAVSNYVLHSKEEKEHQGGPADASRITQLQYTFVKNGDEICTVTCTNALDSFKICSER